MMESIIKLPVIIIHGSLVMEIVSHEISSGIFNQFQLLVSTVDPNYLGSNYDQLLMNCHHFDQRPRANDLSSADT